MDEMHNIASNLKVELVHTDRGFEVKGTDESKVKNMCDHLLKFNIRDHDKQNREAVIKRFVQMDEAQIDKVCQQKLQCMRNYSKELNIEYDPTNLGFEVKGTTEATVKKFCDYLLELKNEVISAKRETSDNGNKMDGDTELKLVKRFVQMKEEEVGHLCNHVLSDMNNFGKELNITFDPTNLGFEVKGKTEDNVKKFCDRLIELKTQILYQDGSSTTDETTKENHVGITPPKETEELLDLPLNIPKKFTQLDERVIHYIDKFKIVEIKEIMVNLDVKFTKSSLGFEIYGEKKENVQTLGDHLMRLNSQIEIKKVENVPDLLDDDLQRLEEKYKCIIKILSDKEEDSKQLAEADLADEAVWCVNGIKVSVAMRDADSLKCDVIVIPMVEEISGKKFVYQEKYQFEEVQVAIPLYKEEFGKEKHDLTQLLVDLLFDLNSHQYNTVALPVKTFNKWPSTKLTKIMLVALKEYLQKPDQNNIQKIYVCSTEPEVCQRAISAMEYAMPDLKRGGFTAVAIKKPRTDKHDHPSIQPADATPETEIPEVNTEDVTPNPTEIPEVNTEDVTPNPRVIQHIKDDTPKLQEEIKPKIIVIKDLIAKQKVDVIVNSTSPDFDLKNGAVSKSILDAAGKEIQKDVKRSSRDIIPGQIVATGGHKLHCKSVYHGCLQGYDKNAHPTEQRSVKILTSFISGCLIKAHRKSYRSIAFPVLGAGALDFPPDVVASMMKKVVEDFGKRNEHTTIEEVRVVVFKDDGIFTIFRMMAEKYNKPTQVELYREPVDHPSADAATKSPEPPKQVPTTLLKDLPTQGLSLALNRVTLSAGLGDVTKLDGFDCLILLWPQDEIKSTPVDKAVILKSVGKSSLTEWEKDKEILSGSKILVTPGGFLPQKTIIHVYVENLCLQDAFMLGLAKAEEMKMKSAVIPVRPTDSLARDVGDFSSCIYRAVTEMNNRLHLMRHVKICIGGKHLCQPILATLAKLQETGGQHFDQTKATCIVEITALKDDMENIMYEINPKTEAEDINNQKDARMADEEEIKSKTLTKDDMEQFKQPSKRFLVNLCAEISPDVIQTALQTNQLETLKMGIERISEKVKISEVDGKWVVYGSYAQIEMCQKDSTEPIDGEIIIKVNITKDLYQALLFLEKRKLSEITGNANLNFIDDAGLLEISGHTIPANVEKQIQELVSSFQANMEIDVVEVPYRLVQNSSVENFVLKLQIDHPDVYIYTNEGKGAESAFPVYLVSLKREDLASAKKSIQTEYLKTSTRAGRFSQSQKSDTNAKFGNPNKFNRSYSLENRKPTHKTYKTEEGLVIHVYMGNILQLNVDCIVNAANSHLMHGGGIAAVIADAAGKAFNKESYEYVKSYGEVKTGHCCVTHAGNLPYKRVIHGVGPHWSKGKADECCDMLQQTIEQCIQTANAHHMTSIAIPSISAGLYGMPAELCAKSYAVGVMTVSANRTGRWSLKEVHFVDNKPDMVFTVQKAFSDFFESSETRRQRSVEESLQTSVEQFKGDTAIIEKLKKNQSLTNAEEIVQRKATVKLNTQTEHMNFTISGSPIDNYILPNSSDLPTSWKVTIKTNLIEIETGPSMKVYFYESDFGNQIMESIAFGKDIDYGQRSTVVQSLRRRTNVKAKLDQLQIQIPKPTVGTVAMFEAVTDIYLQKVFVVFTPKYPRNWTSGENKKFHDNLFGCYLKIFQEVANTKDTEFLAVSFLKTGNKGTSFEEGVKVFLHAVDTFTTNKNPECRLKQIHLIVNKETNALKQIQSVLEQNYKDRGHVIHIYEKADKKALAMVGFKTIMSQKKDMPLEDRNNSEIAGENENKTKEKSKPVDCAICLEEVQDDTKKTLHKCKHVFCKECIDECFRHRPVCPTCGMVYGIVRGTQPTGTMEVEHRPHSDLPGHKNQGCYMINYNFYSGKQTAEHQNPGKSYRGTSRMAYLPANEKGTMVMKLLKIAFDRKLVFTIGHSRTTGEENVVTWNDIHHKTNMSGGAQAFGYPDPEYLDRVLGELAAKGVTKEDLKD
ncbi:DTX [Mytilus coruscus]|uniref:RING-type E3 ubiquitin transferase n=1 Tax=Mytilus coruscus TaxID=42192 RepID=A0A6J8EKZ8_MYTCO|nr:DTX [Mytilus coruscus]